MAGSLGAGSSTFHSHTAAAVLNCVQHLQSSACTWSLVQISSRHHRQQHRNRTHLGTANPETHNIWSLHWPDLSALKRYMTPNIFPCFLPTGMHCPLSMPSAGSACARFCVMFSWGKRQALCPFHQLTITVTNVRLCMYFQNILSASMPEGMAVLFEQSAQTQRTIAFLIKLIVSWSFVPCSPLWHSLCHFSLWLGSSREFVCIGHAFHDIGSGR